MRKLLIIDDERPILQMLEISLSSEGYEVITAENGKEGLKIFEQQAPKLVLTDIKMPEIDGIEVLKRIKSIDNEAEVIVITGHGDMDSAIAALQHGASDFITKPIRDEALILALERARKKIAMSQQLRDYTEKLEQKVEAYTLELRQAQEELIRTERLATIGETVAGLAHYIKNILTGLRGGMYMVNTGMAKDKPAMLKEGWAMVQRNIQRVSDLALDLLRYSKERLPERTVCRPNEIVSEAVELFKERAAEHRVKLDTVLDPNLGEAYLDRDGIHNVLLNLISNAIDACIYDTDTSKGWEVIVKTKLEQDADMDETILFEVTDNGTGMTDEVRTKLFTRFFSTKAGRGTGLGLLNTQKIIREHGGEISVKSKVGKGTTFSVRLKRDIRASMPPGHTQAGT
ncbi:MAG: response regulator [Deltaproteobacteria bacterium]|nr:response regulator [Deltaproteobacteria bacterium]MBW2019010.1 response regulator [Deltaproteobacteria bacterium]MBW2073600.1 response regulator [Deltaproteobacteria bacterium]RLB82686.1 MAG: hybrid sensor histidine kinase/response regulator [Deltaproteobacteria bacterium]